MKALMILFCAILLFGCVSEIPDAYNSNDSAPEKDIKPTNPTKKSQRKSQYL
jgi:PBP1b-binding outer membrane lipoprotein LpoB